jgi:hypothetical protein
MRRDDPMLRNLFRRDCQANDFMTSKLFNEATFYEQFMKDLHSCRSEVIVESPFMTTRRVTALLPIFQKLLKRGVNITINTKHPDELDDFLRYESQGAIQQLQEIGMQVLFTGGHHRKLAILDRLTLWEGSLNILSQNDSCEIMRRTQSGYMAQEMIGFTGLSRFLR